MTLRYKIAVFLSLCLSVTLLQAAEGNIIYIDIVGNADFEVFYDRSTSNATGAVFGGLIGASIQSGIEASNDAKKTKELEPLVNKESWKIHFLDTLNKKLSSKGYEARWIESREKPTQGLILKLYPESFGFRVVDSGTLLMSAYVEFKASVSQFGSKQNEKKSFYITSKEKRPYKFYVTDKDIVNADLQSALNKAAKRLANKIIYSNKV